MKNLDALIREITQLTGNIETNYPELYKFLDENPMTIPSEDRPEMDREALENYLESLKRLLGDHLKSHHAGKGNPGAPQ